jgi:hypothetical protein
MNKRSHFVLSFLIALILASVSFAPLRAQTPASSAATSTNGTGGLIVRFQVNAPAACSVAFSSSDTVPLINRTGCTVSSVPVTTPPNPTPAPLTFAVGVRVATTAKANVWSSVTTDNGVSGLAGTQPGAAAGTISSGPITSSGTIFWSVNFATGVSGWVGQDKLNVTAASPNPTPTPTPTPTLTSDPTPDPSKKPAAIAAFPTAQGGGAASVGGRGGVVIEVTNLNDSGSGSLRSCVEAKGPRTCIFRVAGRITNFSRLQVSNPYLTIAGQTSQGTIVLASAGKAQCPSGDCSTLLVSTHDVIVRYLTYDGSAATPTGPDTGTVCCEMASGSVYNVIWDHMTARWWGNKPFVTTANNVMQPIQNLTVQWSLLYEPNVAHPVVTELDATSGSSLSSINQDFHHNFAANYQHRWPLTNIHTMRWVNNLSYNNLQKSNDFSSLAWGGLRGDYIGNKYVDGPQSVIKVHTYLFNSDQAGPDSSDNCIGTNPCDNPGPPSIYMVNNIGHVGNQTGGPTEGATHVVNDATQMDQTFQGWEGGETQKDGVTVAPVPAAWFRSTPLTAETYPIVADPAENLDAVLLPTVGNSQRLNCDGTWASARDSQDARIIAQYQAHGVGTMFNGQFSAPVITQGAPCVESLHDGIPDQWKQSKKLSTSDSNLYKKTAPTGYTWLETYLNGQ